MEKAFVSCLKRKVPYQVKLKTKSEMEKLTPLIFTMQSKGFADKFIAVSINRRTATCKKMKNCLQQTKWQLFWTVTWRKFIKWSNVDNYRPWLSLVKECQEWVALDLKNISVDTRKMPNKLYKYGNPTGKFAAIQLSVVDTDAWRSLKSASQSLYILVVLEWRGMKYNNNGKAC